MLTTEMNRILLNKIKTLEEDKLFKDKEARQEKTLLEELEKEYKKQANDVQLPALNTDSLAPYLFMWICSTETRVNRKTKKSFKDHKTKRDGKYYSHLIFG